MNEPDLATRVSIAIVVTLAMMVIAIAAIIYFAISARDQSLENKGIINRGRQQSVEIIDHIDCIIAFSFDPDLKECQDVFADLRYRGILPPA